MDKYFEQRENKRGDEIPNFWCFPPMRKRTDSERRRHKEKRSFNALYTNEENLNDSDIDETSKPILFEDIEDEYLEFPDPLEYLIGYFAAKSDSSYKYKTSSYQSKSIHMTASPKKKPPVAHNNYLQDAEPKVLYKSYYDCKKPSRPENITIDISSTMNPSLKSKYREASSLSNSYEKPNMFLKSKNSLGAKINYSKTIEEDDRLCRTLGEDQMFNTHHDSSVDRMSIGGPSFDPYTSSRSYGYEYSSSLGKEKESYLTAPFYKAANVSSNQNSYIGVKKSSGNESPTVPMNISQKMGYYLNSSRQDEGPVVKEKSPTEQETAFAGAISAGSGSVSSTKIKKELEGKRRKKFKKIEYLNKSKVGTTGYTATNTIKMGGQSSGITGR